MATEKVHGAQLVVATDGREVRVGKRKAWLESGEPFFGWQLLRAALETVALDLHRSLGSPHVVRMYGEIFGGQYPHPSVPAMPGASAVQTGIWYAPDIRFALFDVLVESTEEDEGVFLAHHEVEHLGALHGHQDLLLVPLLGRASRQTLETLPVRFRTHVPNRLGLPELDDNFSEGMVLKPDARAKPSERYAVKHKIAEFDEARFDESMPWGQGEALGLDALRGIATRLVNPPRVASARSKVGVLTASVVDEVVIDVLVDIEAAFPAAYGHLSSEDEETLRTHIAARTHELMDTPR